MNILMYVQCILHSVLSSPTNAQHIHINNILYIIRIPYDVKNIININTYSAFVGLENIQMNSFFK